MAESGKRLRRVVNKLSTIIKPGITTNFIDKTAENLIIKYGGSPSFKEVNGYKWTTCLPINEQIVHTPPSDRVLLNGDLLTLDIGFYYKNYHTDFATSFIVGNKKDQKIINFLNTGKKAIHRAIKQAKIGNYIGNISDTIQKTVESAGYNISNTLVGHGIGRTLHEDPMVPGILEGSIKNTPKIEKGLVIAIEVIYMMGKRDVELEKNSKWSVKTADNSLSACFEHTVVTADNEAIILA